MLNEHPLKIRVNTLDDMFRQINILGDDFINKHLNLFDLEENCSNRYIYELDTERNWQLNRRLGYITWFCKSYGIEMYIWRTGEIVVEETLWDNKKSDYIHKIYHLGKFFTKKQMQELKSYIINKYDKTENQTLYEIYYNYKEK